MTGAIALGVDNPFGNYELEKTNKTIDSLKNDVIPEAKGVVRIDVLGGIVLQKVTLVSTRTANS
jgi:hypothetical protein